MNKIKYLLLSIVLFLITGCTNQKNNTLNVLNWSSYIPTEIIKEFEKESNIKVNYNTYSSNEELLAKVSNVSEGTYDVIFPSDYMIEIMINKGLLEKIDKTKLQNINNLNNDYLNTYYDKGNIYSLPFILASTLLSINKECNLGEINSYNDLLKPELKNNIVLIDDQRIIIGMALLALRYDPNNTYEQNLEEAYNWLNKLKPNIKAYDSDSPKNFLITKEACVGLIWNAEGALASFENNNIYNIYPKEGSFLSIDNYAIVKGSKNMDNAYKFIDYLLKPEVMKEIIKSYPYKSVNKETDALLDKTYQNNIAINIPFEITKNSYFIKNIGKDIKQYDKVWIKIKS